MRDMKDSGQAWLGMVPTAWEVCKIKDIKADKKYAIVDGPFGSAISTSDYVDDGVPLIRITNLVNGYVSADKMVYITSDLAHSVERSRIYLNDIVFAKTGATIGKCAINSLYEYAILASSCVKISIDNNNCVLFFYYLFSTDQFVAAIKNACIGTTRDTINLKPFGNIHVVCPSISQQNIIANYLDKKCKKIDNLILCVEQQIEKLKAYKQSLITETVTKGLDSNAEMKESGVEWIGRVPKSYEVKKFKYIASVKSNLVHPEDYLDYMQISPDCIEKGSGKLLECRTVREVGVESDNHLFYKDQILYSKVRPILNKVTIAPFDGLCSADMYPIETTENSKYVVYLMLSDVFLAQVKLTTENRVKMPKINQEEIGTILICLPRRKEQDEIVKYLDLKCEKLDRLIGIKLRKIDELNRYKQSVIYEYVTGKKDVPSA